MRGRRLHYDDRLLIGGASSSGGGGSGGSGPSAFSGWQEITDLAGLPNASTTANFANYAGTFSYSGDRWTVGFDSGGSPTATINRIDDLAGYRVPVKDFASAFSSANQGRIALRMEFLSMPAVHSGRAGMALGILENTSGLRGGGVALEESGTSTRYELYQGWTAGWNFDATFFPASFPLNIYAKYLANPDQDAFTVASAAQMGSTTVKWESFTGGNGTLNHSDDDLDLIVGLFKNNNSVSLNNTWECEFRLYYGFWTSVDITP